MSPRARFYRWALAAPLVGPLLGFALLPVIEELPLVGLVGLFLIGSVSYAWTSYLVLAAGTLVWARGRDEHDLARASLVLPLLYAPVAAVQLAFFYGRIVGSPLWWTDVVSGAALALVFGYSYAGIVRVLARRFAGDEAAPRRARPDVTVAQR